MPTFIVIKQETRDIEIEIEAEHYQQAIQMVRDNKYSTSQVQSNEIVGDPVVSEWYNYQAKTQQE